MTEAQVRAIQDDLVRPMQQTTWRFKLFILILTGVVVWGLFAYSLQLRFGLIETHMRDQVLWGIYISNFVFFIGISHVGALMSAILRLSGAEWRRPITRMAEAITVCSLVIGAS
ncbi:MAG: polysulfide reductase, partial [Anaerolineae bacterium]|nr:polysulfide reductase [Anaerolineae bacterium]